MSGFYREENQLRFDRGEITARARLVAKKIRDETMDGKSPPDEKVAGIISDIYGEQTLPERLNPNPLASTDKQE